MRATVLTLLGVLVGGCFVDSGAMTSLGSASATDASTGGSTGGTTAEGSTAATEVVTGSATDTGATTSPEGQVCDPFSQDCPDGFKCAPYASDGGEVWDANKCVPVMGNDEPGQGCSADGGGTSGYDTCVAGAMCAGVGQDGSGTCVPLCGGTKANPTCSPGLACFSSNQGALNQCVQICDPLLEGDCTLPGDLCVPNEENFVCIVDGSDGSKTDFSPCDYINECGFGRVCGDGQLAPIECGDAVGCCLPLCSLKDPQCPAPTTCLQLFPDPAPSKYVDLGYCGDGMP